MALKTGLIVAAALLTAPAQAQELRFDIGHTLACLDAAGGGPGAEGCIGASANACMRDTPGGSSTYGMGACIDREYSYWDDRLNASYRSLRAQERADDADWAGAPGVVSKADALRDMQRAWIAFRDATCAYERAQWGGGTGGGPAWAGCQMRLTGAQALYLQDMAAEY